MVLSWSAFFASFLVSTAVTCDSTGATVLATYFFVAHPAVPSKLRARAPAIIVSLMAHPFIFPTNLEALIQTLNRRFSSASRETSPIYLQLLHSNAIPDCRPTGLNPRSATKLHVHLGFRRDARLNHLVL